MSLWELPGAELILPGLDDLHNGETNTIGSVVIPIILPRLEPLSCHFLGYNAYSSVKRCCLAASAYASQP
jgi:hypothetical protein